METMQTDLEAELLEKDEKLEDLES